VTVKRDPTLHSIDLHSSNTAPAGLTLRRRERFSVGP